VTRAGAADAPAPPLVRSVAAVAGGRPVMLHVGNATAALDGPLLLRHDITATLNAAVNVDLPGLALPDGTVVVRAKVGLIDGPGNAPGHLLAAALALEGMIAQACPGKPTYPPHRPGNILVCCRAGRSRSVAVVALYLALFQPARHASLAAALDHARRATGVDASAPSPALRDLSAAAFALGRRLGGRGPGG
jgi:hypothetical protein